MMKNNLKKKLKRKRGGNIYVKCKLIELPLVTTSTSYEKGLSKAIVSIRKLIQTFSTGGQFVAGRCLYSNKINDVKDSFLPCQASALFQQVSNNIRVTKIMKIIIPGRSKGDTATEFDTLC